MMDLMLPDQAQQPDEPFLTKVMKDPWFRLGMSLLEQGGPQMQPHSVGQDISRAVGNVQTQDDMDLLRQQKQMQVGNAMQAQKVAQQMLSGMGSPQAPQAQPLTPPQVGQAIAPGAAPLPQAKGKLNVPAQYEPILRQAASMYGVPYELLAAQAQKESGWNPLAKGTSGEIGLSQFMPKTGQQYGLMQNGKDMRSDPRQSIMAQARYMKDLYGQTNDWFSAAHRYNASPDNPAGDAYASELFDIAGMPLPAGRQPVSANQAAPTKAPAPAAQPQQAAPQGGGQYRIPQLPPELHQMFLTQAYMSSPGDPVQMMQTYMQLRSQWTMQQMQNTAGIDKAMGEADYKANLDRETNRLKAQQEADTADDKAFQEGIGKTFAEQYSNIYKNGQAAAGKIDTFRTLGTALSGLSTGAFGGTTQQMIKLGQALGMTGLDEKAAAGDLAETIQNQMALGFRSTANGEGMPGAMSDADRAFLMSLPPGFEKTPAGNKVLIEFYVRMEKRKQEIARMARKYRTAHNGQFDDGFDDEMNSYMEANPLFKDGEIRSMLGGKDKPAAAPAGDRYMLNGREIVVSPDGTGWVYKDNGKPAK